MKTREPNDMNDKSDKASGSRAAMRSALSATAMLAFISAGSWAVDVYDPYAGASGSDDGAKYRTITPANGGTDAATGLGRAMGNASSSQGDSAIETMEVRWTKSSGGERADRFNSVVSRRTDMVSIAVGSTMSRSSGRRDAWISAFDNNGEMIWDTPVGGSRDDEAFAVVDLPDGGVVVVGATSSSGAGASAGMVIKLDRNGTVEWQTLLDTPAADYLYAVSALSSGDLVVAGTAGSSKALAARLDASGGIVWQKQYANDAPHIVRDLAVYSNDDVLMIGESTELFDSDAALARISSAGKVVWYETFGAAGIDALNAGVVLVNGDAVLVGVLNDEELDDQGWLVRVDSKGQRLWEKNLGGPGMDSLSGVRVLGDQTLAIAGTVDSTDDRQPNSWILRISDNGDVLRAKRLGSEFSDGFLDLTPRMDGSFVAVGFKHDWQGEASDGYIAMLGAPKGRSMVPTHTADDPPTVFIPGGGKLLTSEPMVEMIGNIIHDRPITSLFVDGRPARLLHNGAFLTRVSVPIGVTEVKVEAIDDRGVIGESMVEVTRAQASELAQGSAMPNLDAINFGNFHALVIGNNFYNGDIPPLKTAIKDTTELASVLQDRYGFEVELLLNAGKDQILGAIEKKSKSLRKDDNLLIYYAGHGYYDEDSDVGYWLPVDADMENKQNWILNSTITDAVKGMDAKHVLLMADSCFSGTLLRSTQVKRTGKFYNQMASRTARLVMTSGGVEPVLDGGGDGHSVFARSLLAKLRSPDMVIDGTSLYQSIREPVVMSSEQVPQYSNIRFVDSDGGDFLFVKQN